MIHMVEFIHSRSRYNNIIIASRVIMIAGLSIYNERLQGLTENIPHCFWLSCHVSAIMILSYSSVHVL